MRANTANVQSELGSRSHSYLGIVDDEASTFELTGQYCTRLAYTGPLFIATGTTHGEASYLREEHREVTHLFRETSYVKML